MNRGPVVRFVLMITRRPLIDNAEPSSRFNSSPFGHNGRHSGRRHFQMHFLEWKWWNSEVSFTECVSRSSNDNKPALVQVMSWQANLLIRDNLNINFTKEWEMLSASVTIGYHKALLKSSQSVVIKDYQVCFTSTSDIFRLLHCWWSELNNTWFQAEPIANATHTIQKTSEVCTHSVWYRSVTIFKSYPRYKTHWLWTNTQLSGTKQPHASTENCLRKLPTPYIQKVNTSGPRQNGRHFAHDTFKRVFVNENARLSICS